MSKENKAIELYATAVALEKALKCLRAVGADHGFVRICELQASDYHLASAGLQAEFTQPEKSRFDVLMKEFQYAGKLKPRPPTNNVAAFFG